jgi:hypothetical protein
VKRLALLGFGVAALLGSGAPPATAPASGTTVKTTIPAVLGVAFHQDGKGNLVWFDPVSLTTPPGRKAPLGTHLGVWTFSSDRSVLAIAGASRNQPELRFVDARRMHVLGDLRLGFHGNAWNLAWVRPDRLLVAGGAEQTTQLVVVDPRRRRVVRRVELPGPVSASTQVPAGLVLLLGNDGAFRPARIAVVDAEGDVRVATVAQIPIGTVWEEREGESPVGETRQPGLAVDPGGRKAFLVGAGVPVAEIDLATLDVAYRDLSEPISLLGRLREWLDPAAEAKALSGPVRYARWLGDGLIAVAGSDYSSWKDAQGKEQFRDRAFGLRVIDTRAWTVRTLNADASRLETSSGLVFALGGSWDSSSTKRDAVGIVAYDAQARERYRLHPDENVWLNTHGPLGYIYLGDEGEHLEVVDLSTGAVLGRLNRGSRYAWPYLLFS